MSATRRRIHKWGDRNRVQFEPAKEIVVCIHPALGSDTVFKLLGILFDCKLLMEDDVVDILARCRPKINTILRTRNFYSTQELLNQFKIHIWGLLEYHTPAIFHCTSSRLDKIDRLQTSFLGKLDISPREAFLNYNMAPLKLRRDIGLLGLWYKVAHGIAHPSLCALFPTAHFLIGTFINGRPRHDKQLDNHASAVLFREHLWRRSLFGWVFSFNKLPQFCIDAPSVSDFQTILTGHVRTKCLANTRDWDKTFDAEIKCAEEGRYSSHIHG